MRKRPRVPPAAGGAGTGQGYLDCNLSVEQKAAEKQIWEKTSQAGWRSTGIPAGTLTEVDDEPRDGDYYVIRVVVAPNVIKRVKIHYIRLAIDDLPATVRKVSLAKQLIENGDVSFTFPKPPKKSIGLF